jgi:hypothetical protein
VALAESFVVVNNRRVIQKEREKERESEREREREGGGERESGRATWRETLADR